jgi:hypothetical protein
MNLEFGMTYEERQVEVCKGSPTVTYRGLPVKCGSIQHKSRYNMDIPLNPNFWTFLL